MTRPSLLCIHGGATGAWIWDRWRPAFSGTGWQINVLDLRGHGRSIPVDLTSVTMDDYVADVDSVAVQIAAHEGSPPVLVGWGMGGLIALMQASRVKETPGLILLSPSSPLEVAGRAPGDEVRQTPSAPFGPELYGLYPDEPDRSREALFDLPTERREELLARSRGALESGFARRQRQRGISVPATDIQCPVAIISGEGEDQAQKQNGRRLAEYLNGKLASLPDVGRWGMLYDERGIAAGRLFLEEWLNTEIIGPTDGD